MAEEQLRREPTPEEIKANVAKALAEARKADAEAEAVKAKTAAETRKLDAESKEVELKLVAAQYAADRMRYRQMNKTSKGG